MQQHAFLSFKKHIRTNEFLSSLYVKMAL